MTNPAEPVNPDTPVPSGAPQVEPPKTPTPPPAPPVVTETVTPAKPDNSMSELKELIAGMPDRIADALKESRPAAPATPAETPKVETKADVTPGTPPGKRSFADRWFGVK